MKPDTEIPSFGCYSKKAAAKTHLGLWEYNTPSGEVVRVISAGHADYECKESNWPDKVLVGPVTTCARIIRLPLLSVMSFGVWCHDPHAAKVILRKDEP